MTSWETCPHTRIRTTKMIYAGLTVMNGKTIRQKFCGQCGVTLPRGK